jgi:hypothetical protein
MFMLGALLFRMLTGEGLVTGYNAHEALHKVVANGARTLRSVQSGVSRDLDLFYQRLVATERKDRYQSYRELIDTLDKFGGGAKRQTLRLTQNIQAPGTGPHRRPGTGPVRRAGGTAQLRRVGTAELPRGLGTATIQRQQPRSGEYQTASVRKRDSGNGALVGIMVVLALVLGAGIAYVMLNPTLNRPRTAFVHRSAGACALAGGAYPLRHPQSAYAQLGHPGPGSLHQGPASGSAAHPGPGHVCGQSHRTGPRPGRAAGCGVRPQ